MKSSYAALGMVGLALAGLWYAGGGSVAPAQAAPTAGKPEVSAPVAHENLTVFFIHGRDTIKNAKIGTLQEALDAGWAVVHETGSVNSLAVENRSEDTELFIQEGDMIRGGKQDRMIAVDMLISPKSGRVPFPAHCVESGRWTARGGEAATHFSKSDQFAAGNDLRYANATGQQGAVWDNVQKNQQKLSDNLKVKVNAEQSATSFQLALENRVVQAKVGEFEKALRATGEEPTNVVGVVFVVNGQVRGFEQYGSNALFRKAWPKLLRSASVDAIADKDARPNSWSPGVTDIENYLVRAPIEAAQANAAAARDGRTYNESFMVDLVSEDPGLEAIIDNVRGNDVVIQTGAGRGNVQGQGDASNFLTGWFGNPYYQGQAITGRSGSTRTALVRNSGGQEGRDQTRLNPADVQRRLVNNEITLNRPQPAGNRVNEPAPQPLPSVAASPDGNRLNVNRAENASGLISEARDSTRDNAVIHKSFIKLSAGLTPKNALGGTLRGW